MKVRYDKEVDVLYIRLNDMPIMESDEDKPGVILDYSEDGLIVGIEILDASTRIKQPTSIDLEVA
ncbi:DUF2283 domain-containing protein [Larkinella rosea]|uniref:DUF2283 domain-containing protein n=1 Tax=Larkinella rosea TaxID=2025312 RepID=A0A3P1BUF1_9BACT|nr:DUF2283 domain-containing protein [Larkinella rosea]RRB04516.1 DUF2283 domain-containing protein [Larkinella rosea]